MPRYMIERTFPEGLGLAPNEKGAEAVRSALEMAEIGDHPWFFGCQYHPEFTSTPRDGHPLFTSFIKAALEQHKLRVPEPALKVITSN